MKNILLVDDDIQLYNLLKYLSKSIGFNLYVHHNYEDSLKSYLSDEIDFIVVDFSLDYSKLFLNYINKNHPQQKTLIISEELNYSVHEGCEICSLNYHRKRILKPIDISVLVEALNTFDEFKCICKNKLSSPNGLIEIMNYIIKRFSGIKYFSKEKILFYSAQTLVDITYFFEKYHIPFKIIDDNRIQLLTSNVDIKL